MYFQGWSSNRSMRLGPWRWSPCVTPDSTITRLRLSIACIHQDNTGFATGKLFAQVRLQSEDNSNYSLTSTKKTYLKQKPAAQRIETEDFTTVTSRSYGYEFMLPLKIPLKPSHLIFYFRNKTKTTSCHFTISYFDWFSYNFAFYAEIETIIGAIAPDQFSDSTRVIYIFQNLVG